MRENKWIIGEGAGLADLAAVLQQRAAFYTEHMLHSLLDPVERFGWLREHAAESYLIKPRAFSGHTRIDASKAAYYAQSEVEGWNGLSDQARQLVLDLLQQEGFARHIQTQLAAAAQEYLSEIRLELEAPSPAWMMKGKHGGTLVLTGVAAFLHAVRFVLPSLRAEDLGIADTEQRLLFNKAWERLCDYNDTAFSIVQQVQAEIAEAVFLALDLGEGATLTHGNRTVMKTTIHGEKSHTLPTPTDYVVAIEFPKGIKENLTLDDVQHLSAALPSQLLEIGERTAQQGAEPGWLR